MVEAHLVPANLPSQPLPPQCTEGGGGQLSRSGLGAEAYLDVAWDGGVAVLSTEFRVQSSELTPLYLRGYRPGMRVHVSVPRITRVERSTSSVATVVRNWYARKTWVSVRVRARVRSTRAQGYRLRVGLGPGSGFGLGLGIV